MLKKYDFWITVAVANLCLVPLLGMVLRTKFLFDIPFIDYRNILSAHSHFAFGGWVTLMLMILFINNFLPGEVLSKNKYQLVLWATQLTALGMVVTFPFTGYGVLAIIFSTLFIFATYAFCWIFILDFLKAEREKSATLLVLIALVCLIISSAGPFRLAYILATKTGNANQYRDALYTYLHFQYNGFFTFGVFALFANHIKNRINEIVNKRLYYFSLLLSLSVFPALFLSLTWHPGNIPIHVLAIIGAVLTFLALIFFIRFISKLRKDNLYESRMAFVLWSLAMISFVIKLLLQMGIIIPSLSSMVFGFRPIIIGFLHLVFLGFVTFFLIAELIESKAFNWNIRITKTSLLIFAAAIIMNETVLLIQGAGLMLSSPSAVYSWLLWLASIFLSTGAILMFIARLKTMNAVIADK